jgi:hypothetical protein
MSGWFAPPPTIAARRIASVPKELYATTTSEWVLRESARTRVLERSAAAWTR